MKLTIDTSRIVKPSYEGIPPSTSNYVLLSVFDKASFNTHVAVVYAYRPPTPENLSLEIGLQSVLSEYREWAGKLGKNDRGEPVIFVNDAGVRFIEASADVELDEIMPLKPSKAILNFHPSFKRVEELLQVQLTRFTCGSLVIGFTAHHLVADGHSASNFLVDWGKACPGHELSPPPFHDRQIFAPRDPPHYEFEHRGVEFMSKESAEDVFHSSVSKIDIKVREVHFSGEFLAGLKEKASSSNDNKKPYSTFVSLTAHLWRAITRARALNDSEITNLRIAVDGRKRLDPPLPDEFLGNLVIWAFPSAKVKDLLHEPLSYAAGLIHNAIAKVNNSYFRSFIDFASYKVEEEGLVPTADADRSVLCPNVEVHSWLHFPFYELDFGGGSPCMFMPSYFPREGMLLLLPSSVGDGSIDAYIPLYGENLDSF